MTRDEIEEIYISACKARDAVCNAFGNGTANRMHASVLAELCRLALIGEPIDRREKEVAAALEEISDEAHQPGSPPAVPHAE